MMLAGEVLKSRADEVALLKAFTDADDSLLDWSEDSEAIRGFFPNQARLFNDAFKLQEAMAAEDIYLVDSAEAQQSLAEMGAILRDPKPYGRISELPALGETVRRAHDEVVRVGRSALIDRMDAALEEIRDYAEGIELPAGLMGRIEQELAAKKGQVHGAAARASLDALTTQLENWSKAQLAAIDRAVEEERLKQEREESMRKRQEEGVTVLKPNPAASQTHPASSGAGATPTAAEVPEPRKPRTKTIERRDLCRAQRLTSEADIEEYVNAIRKKLEAALADSDTVSIR